MTHIVWEKDVLNNEGKHTLIWDIGKDPQIGDFPSGPVVQNLPGNAWDVGSIPDQGTEVPHAVEQLSPGT